MTLDEQVRATIFDDPVVSDALGRIVRLLIERLKAARTESVYILTRSSMPGFVRVGSWAGDPSGAPELRDSGCEPPFVLAGFARVGEARSVERKLLDGFGGARTVEDRRVVRVDVVDALRALREAADGPIEAPGVEESVRRRLKEEGAFEHSGEIRLSVSTEEAVFTVRMGGRGDAGSGVASDPTSGVPEEVARRTVEVSSVDLKGGAGAPVADGARGGDSPVISKRDATALAEWKLLDRSADRPTLGLGRLLVWLFFVWFSWVAALKTQDPETAIAAVAVSAMFGRRLMASEGVRVRPPWRWRVSL